MRSDASPCLEDQKDLGDLVRILQVGAEPSARDGLLTGLHQEGVGVLARIALGDPVLGGGVYYEAGFARGLGIPVISTCREDERGKLHFDTRQYNHIFWKAPADLADQLHDRVAATALPKGWTAPS